MVLACSATVRSPRGTTARPKSGREPPGLVQCALGGKPLGMTVQVCGLLRLRARVNGKVHSNPAFQAATFSGSVQISGKFSQSETLDLAKLINYGAVP